METFWKVYLLCRFIIIVIGLVTRIFKLKLFGLFKESQNDEFSDMNPSSFHIAMFFWMFIMESII